MSALRFLASVFALLAAVIFVVDYSRPETAGKGLTLTSIGDHVTALAPQALPSARAFVAEYGVEGIWNFIMNPLLAMPGCVAFALLAIIAGYAGRRRERINVFIN